jgi:demethylmenaquinone methyltransferase/2-methoxy-6-polyprenyl-1,4-benzoquinol methylase
MSLNNDRLWKKHLFSKIKTSHSKPVILDIASGTGDIAFNLRLILPDSKIIASDISLEMLNVGREKIQLCNAVCNDMCVLPFDNSSFDYVTGCYALRNAPDLKMVLSEINRVLKPLGRAFLLDFSLYNNRILQKFEIFVLSFWGSLLGVLFHRNPAIYAYIAKSLNTFPNRSRLNQLITNYNFKIIEEKLFFLHFISFLEIEKV